MTINYGGSAGGQPRLFIPTIDIAAMRNVQDPATKKAFEEVAIALNAIKRWSDMLLLGGGGGGLLAFGYYGASTVGNPVNWTVNSDSFSYVSSGLISFPPDSVNLIIAKFDITAFTVPTTDPTSMGISILGNSGATELDGSLFTGGLTAANSDYWATPSSILLFDTLGPLAGLSPLQVESFCNGLSGNQAQHLYITSWEHP